MTKITLGGSRWLHDTTAKWRAQTADAKLDLDKQRLAGNKQTAPPRDTSSVLDRLHTKRQLDPDFIMSGVLHGTGMRYYSDWYLSGLSGISAFNYDQQGGGGGSKDGLPRSEMEAHRRQSYQAAKDVLGDRYLPVVDDVVIKELPIHKVRIGDGEDYANSSVANAVMIERLNTGLRRLAVFYGLLRR